MSVGINKSYQVFVKTLTPLHIGGAMEKHLLKGLDYVEIDKKHYTFNLNEICEILDAEDVANALIEGNLGQLISRSSDAKKKLKKIESLTMPESEIKGFIKDGFGKTYLPGSSLKGALSSLAFGKLKKEQGNDKKSQKQLLGDFENGIFRHIKVGDVYLDKKVELFNSKIFNLHTDNSGKWKGGWKHGKFSNPNFQDQGMIFSYECIPQNAVGTLDLRVLNNETELMKMLNAWNEKEKQQFKKDMERNPNQKSKANPLPSAFGTVINANTLDYFFKLCNDKTRAYLKKEIAFFSREDYKIKETPKILANLNLLLSQIPNDESPATCIFRIAHGSGFHGMTGDWQFDDFINTGTHSNGKKKYKSRKLLFTRKGNEYDFIPMGFILLSKNAIERDIEITQNDSEEEIVEEIVIPKEPAKAEYFKGQIKENSSILDAVVVANNPNQVEVYLNDKTFKIALNYRAEMTIGAVIKIKINSIDKKTMTPKQIGFVGFKN